MLRHDKAYCHAGEKEKGTCRDADPNRSSTLVDSIRLELIRHGKNLILAQFKQLLLVLKTSHLLLPRIDFPSELIDGPTSLTKRRGSRLNPFFEGRLVGPLP